MRCHFKSSNSDWTRFQILAFWSSPRLRLGLGQIARTWNLVQSSYLKYYVKYMVWKYVICVAMIYSIETLCNITAVNPWWKWEFANHASILEVVLYYFRRLTATSQPSTLSYSQQSVLMSKIVMVIFYVCQSWRCYPEAGSIPGIAIFSSFLKLPVDWYNPYLTWVFIN
jgi:hypothetical protein